MFLFRWLGRPPEDFVPQSTVGRTRTALQDAGPDQRLRWNLAELHTVLNDERRAQGLTWTELAEQLGCTPNRLTNLKTAKLADLALTMTVTQWLKRPATEFIYATNW